MEEMGLEADLLREQHSSLRAKRVICLPMGFQSKLRL